MDWTTETPTKDGWYWVTTENTRTKPHIVFFAADLVSAIGPPHAHPVKLFTCQQAEWYGPIEAPLDCNRIIAELEAVIKARLEKAKKQAQQTWGHLIEEKQPEPTQVKFREFL